MESDQNYIYFRRIGFGMVGEQMGEKTHKIIEMFLVNRENWARNWKIKIVIILRWSSSRENKSILGQAFGFIFGNGGPL